MIDVKYDLTIEGNGLKCPYCDSIDTDAWEINFNDDKIEIECDCGKKFWGEKCVMIDYRGEADCELNNEKHDLEPTGNKGQYKCKVCGQHTYDEDLEIAETTERAK